VRFWKCAVSILAAISMVSATVVPASTALAYKETRPVPACFDAWWDPSNFSATLFQPDQAYTNLGHSRDIAHKTGFRATVHFGNTSWSNIRIQVDPTALWFAVRQRSNG